MKPGRLRRIDIPWAKGDMDGRVNRPWHRNRSLLQNDNVLGWDGAFYVAKAFLAVSQASSLTILTLLGFENCARWKIDANQFGLHTQIRHPTTNLRGTTWWRVSIFERRSALGAA